MSLVLWLETTVTFTSHYLPCGKALRSTPCRGERRRVGRGGNGDGNGDGDEEGRPAGTERDRERWKGRQARAGRAAGYGDKKASVGGVCVRLLGVIRGGGFQLGSTPTTFLTDVTGDWSWHWWGFPRPTWTWVSSRRPSSLTESSLGRLGTASSLLTHRVDTASEWQCFTNRHRISRWSPSNSLGPTSLDSRWQRGSGGGTPWDVTLPPTTPWR